MRVIIYLTNPHLLLVVSLQMAKSKPLVQVATLCESVIQEPDKVASIIRIVDTIYLTLPAEGQLAPGQVGAIQLKAFISLKSGDVTGEYDVDLVLRTPSGKTGVLPQKWHVSFLGNESGATATVNFTLPVKEFGLYWYDVIWEGETLTSVPIKLVEGPKPGSEGPVRQTSAIR